MSKPTAVNKNTCVTFKKQPLAGFTIVELLVIIIVIAILATIVVVSYNGVTARATETALKSDLMSAASLVESERGFSGNYPADAASADYGRGLKAGDGRILMYVKKTDGYCMSIKPSTTSSPSFKVTNGDNTIVPGTCEPTVITLAGSGTAGPADGAGTAAQFNKPDGVAVDSSGVVYVADENNHRIRKITPAGVVSTLAGSGTAGNTNGTGTAAQFSYPRGVAVDASGTVYVADMGNQRIRKITAAGVVTTLAGSSSGYVDATGTSARFNTPQGVGVDSSGNVYVADSINRRIRKITAAGVVTTLAGSGAAGFADGTGTAAQFNTPWGLGVDSSGVVYVADTINNRIRKITAAGVVTTLAGSGAAGPADGTGTAAQFNNPSGVAVDSSGNVYVADWSNHNIRKITPSGAVTTLAGSGVSGFADEPGTAAKFSSPWSVAVDSSGSIYVADSVNNRIRKITP